jgi:predicted transglutaminase-like cysteine proteinase
MLAYSGLRAGARMAAVAAALVFCAGGTLARAPIQVPQAAQESPETTGDIEIPPFSLAAFPPANAPIAIPPARVDRGPFGLAAADTGSYTARWRLLQPAIQIERKILAFCRSSPDTCPAAAAKFGAIVEAARARSGLARIGEINRAVNLTIRPVSDLTQYGVPDVWASPLMTFSSGAGDCEDYAIAKYVALLEAGLPREDLRLIVVYNRPVHEQHMVAAAKVDGRWVVLDNRTMRLIADADIADLAPLAMLDTTEPSPSIAAAPAPQASEASAGIPAETRDVAGVSAEL